MFRGLSTDDVGEGAGVTRPANPQCPQRPVLAALAASPAITRTFCLAKGGAGGLGRVVTAPGCPVSYLIMKAQT